MNLAKKSTILLAALGAFCATSCGSKTMNYEQALKWVEKNYEHGEDKKVLKVNYEWDYTANAKKEVIKDTPLGDVDINFLVEYSIQEQLKIKIDDKEKAAKKGSRKNVKYTGGLWLETSTFDKDLFAKTYEDEDPETEQEFTVNGKKLTAKEKFTSTRGTDLGDVTYVETDIRALDELGYTYSIELKMQQKDIKLTYNKKTYNLGDLNAYYKTTVVERAK